MENGNGKWKMEMEMEMEMDNGCGNGKWKWKMEMEMENGNGKAKLFWVLVLSFYIFKIIYFLKFEMNNYYFSVTLCNFISYTML